MPCSQCLGGQRNLGGEPGSVSAPYFIFITELSMVIGFIQNVLHNNFLPVLLGGLCGHSREVGADLKGPLFFFYWDAVRRNMFIFSDTRDGDGDKSVLKPHLLERL